MTDPIDAIVAANQGRWPDRLRVKFTKMAEGAFPFYRATSHLFYSSPLRRTLPASPLVAGCGDAHVENVGAYEAADGGVVFDLNDFDEATTLPLAAELARFGASVVLAGRASNIDDERTKAALADALAAYRDTTKKGPFSADRRSASRAIAGRIEKAAAESRGDFLASKTSNGASRLRVDGGKDFGRLQPGDPGREAIQAAVRQAALVAGYATDAAELLDVARRHAGTGSAGRPRYAALVSGLGGAEKKRIIDFKSAWRGPAQDSVDDPPFRGGEAERIVARQRRALSKPHRVLAAVTIDGHPFVAREFHPRDKKFEVDEHIGDDVDAFAAAVADIARLLASAHLRGAGWLGAAPPDDLKAWGGGSAHDALIVTCFAFAEEARDAHAAYLAAGGADASALAALTKG